MARGSTSSSRRDRQVTILRPSVADDGFAQVVGEPVEIGTHWASKYDVSDGERIRAAEQGSAITTRFGFHWNAVMRAIDTTYFLRFEGRDYEVTGVKEVGRREGIEVTATARTD